MKSFYDWVKLKNKFILGSWLTIASFFKEKGIKNNSYSRTRVRGWLQERNEYHKKILIQAQSVMVDDEVKIRRRQQLMAKQLQVVGFTQLKNKEVRTAEEARKLIETGLREERAALGLNDSKTTLGHTSAHSPFDSLDAFVEKLSYTQILELIAEIKRINGQDKKKNEPDAYLPI